MELVNAFSKIRLAVLYSFIFIRNVGNDWQILSDDPSQAIVSCTLITECSIIVNHLLSFTATNGKSRSFVAEMHFTRDVLDSAYHQLHVSYTRFSFLHRFCFYIFFKISFPLLNVTFYNLKTSMANGFKPRLGISSIKRRSFTKWIKLNPL